jgi:hypothetical protein
MAGLEDIKSLTVRPPDLTRTTDRIPWTSIAGALGFASRPASLYGRAKYALEPHYHKEILFELFKIGKKIKWSSPRGGFKITNNLLKRMCILALSEGLSPSCCPKCGGRGKIFVEQTLYTCTLCNGVGRKSISERVRANYLIMDKMTYNRCVKYNYHHHFIGALYNWERELINALRRA